MDPWLKRWWREAWRSFAGKRTPSRTAGRSRPRSPPPPPRPAQILENRRTACPFVSLEHGLDSGGLDAAIPVVLHVHNPDSVAFQNLNRIAARKVLFCSSNVMENFGHLERIANKAEVLYNVVDTNATGGAPIRAALGLNDGDIAIGTVAQVVERRA